MPTNIVGSYMTTARTSDSLASGSSDFITAAPSRRSLIPEWLQLIQDAVEAAEFGTIQIKVHNGEVVQIETTRKIHIPSESSRFHPQPTAPAEELQ
jgi:hypothetical protein